MTDLTLRNVLSLVRSANVNIQDGDKESGFISINQIYKYYKEKLDDTVYGIYADDKGLISIVL